MDLLRLFEEWEFVLKDRLQRGLLGMEVLWRDPLEDACIRGFDLAFTASHAPTALS